MLNLRRQDREWYVENVIEPIYKEMLKIKVKGKIVLNLYNIKGYTNKPPLIEDPESLVLNMRKCYKNKIIKRFHLLCKTSTCKDINTNE